MTDLNTAIAKHKGMNVDNCWSGKYICPDYEHDANLYMALYFELPITERINFGFRNKDDFGREVCVAFCKLKGIEL